MDIFIGIFSLVISVACFWMGFKFLNVYLKVRNWQRVKAKVISKSASIHEKIFSAQSPYKLNAEYTYNIDGVEYSGSKVYLLELLGGRAGHMKRDVDKKLDRIMGIMLVYVDPKDHSRSVMFCEGVGMYVVVIFMGIFSLLFGIYKLV